MSRQIVALCTVLALLTVPSYQQGSQGSTLTSPCPNVFMYDPPGTEPGWWSGVVTLSSDILLHSVWLNIVLDSQALSLGQLWDWIGNATTQDRVDFRIDNDDMEIYPGHPVLARFFIQYDPLNTTPRLRSIRLNGKVICNTDTYQKATDSRPGISHTNVGQPGSTFGEEKLWTNLDMMPVQTPQSESSYSDYPRPVNNYSAAFNSEHGDSNIPATSETVECGVVSEVNEVASLSSERSHAYIKGDLPWIALIYKRQMQFKHLCTGTLVSDRHIVTVANSVGRSKNLKSADIVVRLGMHDLNNWSDDSIIIRNIATISLHPDFDMSTLKNNIAVLTLDSHVKFNAYIRPACLWSGDTELSRVVGTHGVVASWGLRSEEVKRWHEEPLRVLVPIVSTNYCRASNPLFHQLTSNTTLCAGSRNGVGPCTGDSGAGLYILDGGKWRLRGLVSVSLRAENTDGDLICNLDEYIVYTDTAQFLAWLTNIVSEK